MNDLVVLTCKESNPLLIPTGEDSAVLGVRDTMGVIGDGDGWLILNKVLFTFLKSKNKPGWGVAEAAALALSPGSARFSWIITGYNSRLKTRAHLMVLNIIVSFSSLVACQFDCGSNGLATKLFFECPLVCEIG